MRAPEGVSVAVFCGFLLGVVVICIGPIWEAKRAETETACPTCPDPEPPGEDRRKALRDWKSAVCPRPRIIQDGEWDYCSAQMYDPWRCRDQEDARKRWQECAQKHPEKEFYDAYEER